MSKIFKWAITVIIIATFINGLAFIGFGVVKTYRAYHHLINQQTKPSPAIELVESLDNFLIALVFLIFSSGFAQLFYPNQRFFGQTDIPALKIDSLHELKMLLWSTLLLTLVIAFTAQAVSELDSLDWKTLIVPSSILLLAVSSKFLFSGK